MVKFYLSNAAENDLLGIAKYTEENWGVEQSNSYIANLDKCFSMIAENPAIGQSCSSIRHGYHKYNKEKHVIFYQYRK